MFRTIGDGSVFVSRCLLVGLVVLSSALYALTRVWTKDVFCYSTAGIFGLWLFGHLLAFRLPKVPVSAVLLVLTILAFGWTSVGLQAASDFIFETEDEFLSSLYDLSLLGTVSLDLSIPAMVRTTALLGTLLLFIDAFSLPSWSKTLLVAFAATVTGMIVLFLLQRTVGGPFLIRSDLDPRVFLSFATYRYWGNAASYLNLAWPILAAIAIHATCGHRARGWLLWISLSLLTFAAVFLNISKAGHVLAPAGLIALTVIVLVRHLRRTGIAGLRVSPAVILGAGIPVAIIMVSLVFAIPVERWERLIAKGFENNERLVGYRYFWEIVPDAHWTGFGPGTFEKVYWGYIDHDPLMRRTPFWVAHQDYLQTLVEWGWAGTILWGLFFAIPIIKLLARLGGRSRFPDQRDEYALTLSDKLRLFWEAIPSPSSPTLAAGALVAIGLTALHAAVDFPMQVLSLQFYLIFILAIGWNAKRFVETAPDDADESM